MEFALRFDHEQNVLVITLGEVVTRASATAAAAAVRTFIAAQDVRVTIADLSAIERIEVSPNFVWFLSEKTPVIPPNQLCILVAPKDETYGMGRMFQMLRDGMGGRFEVVRSMEEAYKLLGLRSLHLT